ncbi:MAG: hypothetical protein CBC83_05795 [Flavobacteriales bacterium TMED123]|nr:MAG: hypothetical protein CBC83_05795 [Flavobacteriales bacterium TMED123]
MIGFGQIQYKLDSIKVYFDGTSTLEYINAISKLLPYSIGKIKPYEDVEEIEPISINIICRY